MGSIAQKLKNQKPNNHHYLADNNTLHPRFVVFGVFLSFKYSSTLFLITSQAFDDIECLKRKINYLNKRQILRNRCFHDLARQKSASSPMKDLCWNQCFPRARCRKKGPVGGRVGVSYLHVEEVVY